MVQECKNVLGIANQCRYIAWRLVSAVYGVTSSLPLCTRELGVKHRRMHDGTEEVVIFRNDHFYGELIDKFHSCQGTADLVSNEDGFPERLQRFIVDLAEKHPVRLEEFRQSITIGARGGGSNRRVCKTNCVTSSGRG